MTAPSGAVFFRPVPIFPIAKAVFAQTSRNFIKKLCCLLKYLLNSAKINRLLWIVLAF